MLRTNTVPPEIQILFRWARDPTLFGVREPVEQGGDERPAGMTAAEELASMITISLEENLLAIGFGIENAIRQPQGEVTWLRWTSNYQGSDLTRGSSAAGKPGNGCGASIVTAADGGLAADLAARR